MRDSPANKLKAVMDVVRDLHTGGWQAKRFVSVLPEIPKAISKILEELSKVSAWIRESKRSACRQGAMRALAICRIYNPFLKSAQLVWGFPTMKADGCRFVREDYQQAVKETRVYATLIAEDINVETFEPGYDEHDKGILCRLQYPLI